MKKAPKSRNFIFFFAELFILILGISASFLLNEWRVNKQERDQEKVLLKSYRNNLIADSTTLYYGVQQLDSQVVYAQKVINFNDNELSNEVITQVLSLLNYVPFNSNDITYQEMKSVGSSRLIQNDSLLADLIGLYENNFEIINTWTDIDGEHVRQRMIPYVESNFPFATNLNYFASDSKTRKRLLEEIKEDQFKHLVQFGMSYKATESMVVKSVLSNIKKVLTDIEEELATSSSDQIVSDQENTSQDPQ